MSDSASRENSGQRSRRPWFVVTGCLLLTLIGLFLTLFESGPPVQPGSADIPRQDSNTGVDSRRAPLVARARLSHGRSSPEPARTAEEIVAGKLAQFARSRREIVHGLARRAKVPVPDEVERFFGAIEAGRWEEADAIFKSLRRGDNDSGSPRFPDLGKIWRPIQETWGIAGEVHNWPAQKLLDYGDAILGSLRPGMVYVGGTDPGCFIPTMLNETTEGERHIVFTQNALADSYYLDYLNFLYPDRLATLTSEDHQHAFADYLADAQKRLQHDQQFPDEPKQVRPGEDVKVIDGRVQVSGQTAVMAINEQLLRTLMAKNPDLSFALEESFPLKSTYADAAPLGPIMELRAQDGQSALTAERAAQSLDYWRAATQQMLSDPEASGSPETLKTWSKMAVGQANLFADRNFTAEAEQTYRLSMEMWPRNIESIGNLSDLLVRTGRAEEAHRLVQDFVRNNSDLTSALESFHPGITATTQPTPPARP
jgi:hypothetical protein